MKCVTWPSNSEDISPISSAWGNMNRFVDKNYTLNCFEIKSLISSYWDGIDSDQFVESYGYTKSCLGKLIVIEGGPIQ